MKLEKIVEISQKIPTPVFILCLIIYRVWNALFVRTYFNPDEFWQSIEVAHEVVFKYGYLTWEWTPPYQLRGYLHPMIFAALYKVLEILGIDTRWNIAYLPRVLQGCFASLGDYYVYKLSKVYFNETTARWVLLCQLGSWFNFYCLIRPYSNSMETVLTLMALYYWPSTWIQEKVHSSLILISRRRIALLFASIAIIIRPTNIILWLFLGIRYFIHTNDKFHLMTYQVIPIGGLAISTMLIIDRIGYGNWTFVPWNFIQFNVLQGKDRLYGTHPWHWYFSQGYPSIVGTFLPFIFHGVYLASSDRREYFYMICFGLFVYSFSAHKEFRFILPFLPISMVYAGHSLKNTFQDSTRNWFGLSTPFQRLLKIVVFVLIFLPNLMAALYLSRWHQRGPLEAMDFLSQYTDQRSSNISIHFLTPCHATPYYSHLHSNVSLWFPDCSPWNRENASGSESEQLSRSPKDFFMKRYYDTNEVELPDFFVGYSGIMDKLSIELQKQSYHMVESYFHSHVSGDADEEDVAGTLDIYQSPKGRHQSKKKDEASK